jgi:hypothetical protein
LFYLNEYGIPNKKKLDLIQEIIWNMIGKVILIKMV